MVRWKLYGLQRTCTNAVRLLIRQNFVDQVGAERGGDWKHGPIRTPIRDTALHCVICVRAPYVWALSMYHYNMRNKGSDGSVCRRFRKGWDFARFLTSPTYRWPDPVRRWNEMNLHYLDWHDTHKGRAVLILGETMMTEQGQKTVMAHIAHRLNMKRKGGPIHPILKRVNNSSRTMGPMNFDRYTERRWTEEYTPGLIDHINQRVDRRLMDRLGYVLEDPHGF